MCVYLFFLSRGGFARGDMCLYGFPICHVGVPVKFFWFDVFVELLLHRFSPCSSTELYCEAADAYRGKPT